MNKGSKLSAASLRSGGERDCDGRFDPRSNSQRSSRCALVANALVTDGVVLGWEGVAEGKGEDGVECAAVSDELPAVAVERTSVPAA